MDHSWAGFSVWYPNGLVFFTISWYLYGSNVLVWSAHSYLFPEEEPPGYIISYLRQLTLPSPRLPSDKDIALNWFDRFTEFPSASDTACVSFQSPDVYKGSVASIWFILKGSDKSNDLRCAKCSWSNFNFKTSTSKGFIRHKYTKAKQKHAYYIVMSGDSY